MNRILILTATITPPAEAKDLAFTDPKIRLGEYEATLKHLGYANIASSFSCIIFVENSGFNLDSLKNKFAFVEFISLEKSHLNRSEQRGFCELLTLRDSMTILNRQHMIGDDDLVYKMTGRYRLENMNQIISDDFDLHADFRTIPDHWMDMRFMGFRYSFFMTHVENILNLSKSKEFKNISMEVICFEYFQMMRTKCKVKSRFSTVPRFNGVCGATGINYLNGMKNKTKYCLRVVLRKAAPFIWV